MLYTGDWLKDPSLGKCSPATRGVWIDMLCAMHENGRSGKLSGTAEQLARILRCSPDEVLSACNELGDSKTANVTLRNGHVTVINRRMSREAKERKQNALRQARHRRNAQNNGPVTPPSQPSSSSSSISSSKDKKKSPIAERSDKAKKEGIA